MARKTGKVVGSYDFMTEFAHHKVDLRLDTSTGEFSAEYLGVQFRNKDLNVMKKDIRDETKKREQVKWDPFVEIEVKGDSDETHHSFVNNCVGLEFSLQYIATVGDEKWHKHGYVRRHRDTGDLEPSIAQRDPSRLHEDKDKSYIPYTDERWKKLTQIQEAINDLRKRLREVLVEAKSEEIERLLDSYLDGGLKLLTAPEASKE